MWSFRRLKQLLLAGAIATFPLGCVAQEASSIVYQSPGPSNGWNYENHGADWPKLFPDYCAQEKSVLPTGQRMQQSPIRIKVTNADTNQTLKPDYNPANVPIQAHEHDISVDYSNTVATNQVEFNGATYRLIAFHFHQPAEHVINNTERAEMELHLIHQGMTGNLLVIAVQMIDGEPNDSFEKILNNVGGTQSINPMQMMPEAKDTPPLRFYTYTGSLTTPRCSPPVTWVVLADPIHISNIQYTNYTTMNDGKYANTNRIIQNAIEGLVVSSNFK